MVQIGLHVGGEPGLENGGGTRAVQLLSLLQFRRLSGFPTDEDLQFSLHSPIRIEATALDLHS